MTSHSLSAAFAITLFALPAAAQDSSPGIELPAICGQAIIQDMGSMPMDKPGVDQAHQDLAMGMDLTNAQMMESMKADDLDVAFVCAMIPHHQAAINMARAELSYGDNDWAKQMAQKVIDAQQAEIEDMLKWLGDQK